MNEYPPQDIEINIFAWNKTINCWHKMECDWINQFNEMDEDNPPNIDDINDLIYRRHKCIKMHHNSIQEMSLSVSDQWFKTIVNKESCIPTIPKVIKQLIKQYALTCDLSTDTDFKIKYDKRLQNRGRLENQYK